MRKPFNRARRTLAAMASSAALLCAITLATPAVAQTSLLLSHIFPAQHPLVTQVLQPWAKDIETATAGRVKVEFSPSSLAPPPGQLDMVQKGIADIGLQFAGVVPNRLHFELITEIPGTAGTTVQMSRALWSTYEQHFSKSDAYKGMHVLALFTFPQQDFFCLKACPSTMAEMKSLKILTTPSTPARQFGALTSGVVAVPAIRYFEPISKGVVDAYAGTTAMESVALNLAQHTKGILRFKDLGTAGPFAVLVNPAKWSQISAADRSAIQALGGAAFAARLGALDEAVAGAHKRLADMGITVTQASAQLNADLAKAYDFIDDEWIKESTKRGVDGAAALRHYREQVRR